MNITPYSLKLSYEFVCRVSFPSPSVQPNRILSPNRGSGGGGWPALCRMYSPTTGLDYTLEYFAANDFRSKNFVFKKKELCKADDSPDCSPFEFLMLIACQLLRPEIL